MPAIGIRHLDKSNKIVNLTWEEADKLADSNPELLPMPFDQYLALTQKLKTEEPKYYRVSKLTSCPRANGWREVMNHYTDFHSLYNMYIGTLFHSWAEETAKKYPDDIMVEVEVEKTIIVDGESINLTGHIDRMDRL